ncbi:DNA-3-methyladenine glycosylase 2 family protein [Pontibacterium granulatum]|uniref:DNA-3-methyladenine glycosylase family protein n=1 Tax=Pontibacterium granulatum TaxID=2036029 RepID=UPI00249A96C4|nr:DNA-3-methyladenine glycosylase [Pontibacterium granulatum]MDI3324129.1 DNA-3-methyladenine glycosylase 2 family protein [Pontibacterium granulatum]
MDKTQIVQGLEALSDVDTDIAKAYGLIGAPEPRVRPTGFSAFLSIIIGQQVSTEAANAIRGRVEALLGDVSAERVIAVEDQALREAGMSFRKIEYAKGLAEAQLTGTFDAEGLDLLTDEEVIESITALRGFGRWSAEIYMMFSLGRQDVFPADDLAIQVALGRLKGLEKKPTPKQARDLIEHWSPWRSVGSLFLWHYYRGAPT